MHLEEDRAGRAASAEDLPPVGWQAPLVDGLAAIARRIKLLVLIVCIGIGVGVYQTMTRPSVYRSSCVALLLPREKPQLDVAVNAGSIKTGMDAARREASGPLMLPPNTDLYAAILLSPSVLLTIAEQFADRLRDQLADGDGSDEVVRRLRSMLEIAGTEEGMITIHVTAADPGLAADIANALVVEMENASKAIERQLIVRQSGFLGKAESTARGELVRDEAALARFYSEHGVVDMATQAADVLRMTRELRMSRSATEHDLLQRLESYTEDDPGVETLRARLAKFDDEISALRNSYFDATSQEAYGQVRIEFEALRDRVRFKRDLVATLSTQRSVFDIRSEQPAGSVAVLKAAVPPARPFGRSKKVTIGLAAIVAAILGVVLVLLLEQWRGSADDPYIARRVAEVRERLVPNRGRAREPVLDEVGAAEE